MEDTRDAEKADAVSIPPAESGVCRFVARRECSPGLFFAGPLWYGHLCKALGLDRSGEALGDAGVAAAPLEPGVGAWRADEPAHVRVLAWGGTDLATLADALGRAPADGNPAAFTSAFAFEGLQQVSPADAGAEAAGLQEAAPHLAGPFILRFRAPTRVKRGYARRTGRGGAKKKVRVYVDERDFSLGAILRACWARVCALAGHPFEDPAEETFRGRYTLAVGDCPLAESTPIPPAIEDHVLDRNLLWLRTPYSKSQRDGKDPGGIQGEVRLSGGLPLFWRYCLLAAGRRHIGAYGAFGFGWVEAPEASAVYPGEAHPRMSVLERAIQPGRLRAAAGAIKGTAADVDGVTPADLARARPEWYDRLRRAVLEGSLPETPMKSFRVGKKDQPGESRTIHAPAAADRVLQRAVHCVIAPAVDAFLSSASFAFRSGLNRESAMRAVAQARREGYTLAVGADIESFFDAADWQVLERRLRVLYGDDPIVGWLMRWVRAPVESPDGIQQRAKGLPQGMTLSPLLANVILDAFDREIEALGLRLVRYCDDFLILLKPEGDPDTALAHARDALAELGLHLREDKTRVTPGDEDLTFLGLRLAPESDAAADESEAEDPAPSAFTQAAAGKRSVYLGGNLRGARSHGNTLVLLDKQWKPVESIPWRQVGRIVASGRVNTTGGVQREALKRGIPILYLSLWGLPLGEAIPAASPASSLVRAQEAFAEDAVLRQVFQAGTAEARIHNMRVVLRRNGVDEPTLKELQRNAAEAGNEESRRGFEGSAARKYWGHFAALVQPFAFPGRQYRPPPEPVNALLSLFYTLLHHRIASVLRAEGFDPGLGLRHANRSGHAALASDLIEEFRHVAELLVLRMVHLQIIAPAGFPEGVQPNGQPCKLPPAVFRKAVLEFESRIQAPFTPRKGKKTTLFGCMEDQVRELRAAVLLKQPYTALCID